ncbi:MAG: hypothetical protein CMJ81_08875 [Planctomycetaceae bacterium]|nr:hypothetical protein [Planctomycetaceae bacterium]
MQKRSRYRQVRQLSVMVVGGLLVLAMTRATAAQETASGLVSRAESGNLNLPTLVGTRLDGLQAYRLLDMDMDQEGQIWVGSTRGRFLRYDPQTRLHRLIQIPGGETSSCSVCVGTKVYVLGQKYPRLRVYDRVAGRWQEYAYPTRGVDFWYATPTRDRRQLVMFNYGDRAVVFWDTETDTGSAVSYSLEGPPPGFGFLAEEGRAMYSVVSEWPYRLLKLVRLDMSAKRWSQEWAIPHSDDQIARIRPGEPDGEVLWMPHTMEGYLLAFHTGLRRWTDRMKIPGYGENFHFVGFSTRHAGLHYFSVSTFDGVEGRPHHFLNALLVFDLKTRQFDLLRLPSTGNDYHQVSYTLSAGGRLFCTGTNIRQADGSLVNGGVGDVIFWQSGRSATAKVDRP